jgi:hypothetical protein
MTYANGDVYMGEFVDGKRQGHGNVRWAETGLTFEGEWANDASLYQPTALELSELPPITPGTALAGIAVSVVGGAGESGRVLNVTIEIGRADSAAAQKKQTKTAKKGDTADHEVKLMVLNSETGDTFLELVVEHGKAVVPPIPVPLDAEQSPYTITVTDTSATQALPEVSADFAWVSAASATTGQAARGAPRGGRRGGTGSRNSDRKSVRGGK